MRLNSELPLTVMYLYFCAIAVYVPHKRGIFFEPEPLLWRHLLTITCIPFLRLLELCHVREILSLTRTKFPYHNCTAELAGYLSICDKEASLLFAQKHPGVSGIVLLGRCNGTQRTLRSAIATIKPPLEATLLQRFATSGGCKHQGFWNDTRSFAKPSSFADTSMEGLLPK